MAKKGYLLSAQRKPMPFLDSVQKDLPIQRTTGSRSDLFSLFKKYPMGSASRLTLAFNISSGSSRAKEGLK
ncbi:MAG: hypothetical protein KAT69_10545 [Candidatus Aminicenantes bacterium]|nr:hypothetical protein [Candidatus Aminicenantes bacterium]